MGRAFTIHHESIDEALAALGIEHSKVFYLKIETGMDMLTTIEVQYIVDEESLGDLSGVIKKYVLKIEELS